LMPASKELVPPRVTFKYHYNQKFTQIRVSEVSQKTSLNTRFLCVFVGEIQHSENDRQARIYSQRRSKTLAHHKA